MWISLDASAIKDRLTDLEKSAFTGSASIGEGAAGEAPAFDALPGIIAQVCEEVRGYVAGHGSNPIGPAGMIPARLESASVSIIRYRLLARLPVSAPAFLEQRRKEFEDAVALLEKVASGKFAVDSLGAGQSETDRGTPTARGRSGSAFGAVSFSF